MKEHVGRGISLGAFGGNFSAGLAAAGSTAGFGLVVTGAVVLDFGFGVGAFVVVVVGFAIEGSCFPTVSSLAATERQVMNSRLI